MIRKFLKTLTTKLSPFSSSKPALLPGERYGITPEAISEAARRVCETLQQHGHQGFIVGGAVRDLILGRTPKDFDVATDARPERVHALFRRSRLIGRRFRLVHVYFGQETIEVATFRAHLTPDQAEIDEHGRLLTDNTFGTIEEDAARRDFTANALYYDPIRGLIHDYHHGVGDLAVRTLKVIGDPETRYREDPVRMLRAVRLAVKLGLTIDPAAHAPFRRLAPLLAHVPRARLADEFLKILHSGHAERCLETLIAEGLAAHAFPPLEKLVQRPEDRLFVQGVLAATDERIQNGKSISAAFALAALLWPALQHAWHTEQAAGLNPHDALYAAGARLLSTDSGALIPTRALAAEIRELWYLQPRFEKRLGHHPYRLLAHPRYRAAWELLALRARLGDSSEELVRWWDSFADASEEARAHLIRALHPLPTSSPKKKRRRKRAKPPSPSL
ncbi:MAG: polynucleotide adenylyltransferase PcnB [Hydrogenophilus sp.]|nr:polynucleotide adenylyltransferase PcnB [Hydrogenophilus sp.]